MEIPPDPPTLSVAPEAISITPLAPGDAMLPVTLSVPDEIVVEPV